VRTIWKHVIPAKAVFMEVWLPIPVAARFIHCAPQFGEVALWFEVPDTEGSTANRGYRLYGTGQPIDERFTYVGTALMHNGELVLHVYEVPL